MTEQLEQIDGRPSPLLWRQWFDVALIALVSLLTMCFAYVAAGATFGLILAGTVTAMCAAIGMSAINQSISRVWISAAVVAGSISIPIVVALHFLTMAAAQAVVFNIAFVALIIVSIRSVGKIVGYELARLAIGIIVIAWLTLPIWASHLMTSPRFEFVVDLLLAYQPVIALNSAFLPLGEWAHQPFAYKWLTNLGQDVPYAMPNGAWRGIGLHLLLAIAISAILQINSRSRGKRP